MRFGEWRAGALVIGCLIAIAVLVAGFEVLNVFWRPPQPLKLGTIQWLDEVGATVDSVDRVPQIGRGPNAIRAKGEFYIVHARIIAPFGVRPTWQNSDVEVNTYAHTGRTLPTMKFSVDERAQAAFYRGAIPDHEVRGAEEHIVFVFDMPRNVEQPGLVFLPANDPAGMLDLLFGIFWQPHRFNLRYD